MESDASNIRKRGRPRIDATPLTVRFPPGQLDLIDDWIARFRLAISRPEAVRMLVERTLTRRKGQISMPSKEFEIARILMIEQAKQENISDTEGFAWAHRIYPCYSAATIAEVFRDDFEIDSDKVDMVANLIEEIEDKEGSKLDYYYLESKLNVRDGGPLDRVQLIKCCRYIFLDHRFNASTWKRLTKLGSGPVESQGIAKDFDKARDLTLGY